MEPLNEEEEGYTYREVVLPALIPVVQETEGPVPSSLDRRQGRDILVAVDHTQISRDALHWALVHLCRLADTLHLVFAVPNVADETQYEVGRQLLDSLAVEAYQIAMLASKARIVEGDAGRVICHEAERIRPAAVVMGTRGRGRFMSVLQGSVSEYCLHNCKVAPVVVVPGKDTGNRSVT